MRRTLRTGLALAGLVGLVAVLGIGLAAPHPGPAHAADPGTSGADPEIDSSGAAAIGSTGGAVETELAGSGTHPVATIAFDPQETAVEPGDSVELDVTLEAARDFTGAGAREVTIRLDYPAAFVEVTDLETASWLAEDPDEVTTAAWIDSDAGVAALERTLVDPGDGAAGDGRFATVTLEIAEDAPRGSISLTARESRLYYVAEDYPGTVYSPGAELHVNGGGDPIEPDVAPDHEFADEHAIEPSTGAEADDETDDDGEALPVPLPVGGVLLLVMLGGLFFRLLGPRPG